LTPKWEFKINQWPNRQEGKWQMEMDNTLLIKIAAGDDLAGIVIEGNAVKDKPAEKIDSKKWQCEG